MRLTPHEGKDKIRIIAICAMIIIAGLSMGAAFWAGRNAQNQINTGLSERSQSIAASLDATQIAKLVGDSSDADTQTYADLKTQLAAVKHANPDARSIYLMGRHGQQVFFFVDSEQPDSSQYSPAGDPYNDGTAADSAIFDNGRAFVEGPATDSYGTFISGLAPIFKPGTSTVMATLGIDVGADTYWQSIASAALMPLLIGTIIILIIGIYERIRRRNAELLAMRSELVSVASHELRNPITGIRWAGESLLKLTSDPRLTKMAKAIVDSATRLQASTNDILELSHATSGRRLTIQQVDLVALLQEIITTQSLSAQQKGVKLGLDSYWPKTLSVQCAPDQMRRAIHNVISNAIKYTRDGTKVTISYQQDSKQHKILVTDMGIGIPASEQGKVFRGFYRASNAVKSDIPGTGLGLYLVKTVFERHGGSVSFVSEENKGTTFTLCLPK